MIAIACTGCATVARPPPASRGDVFYQSLAPGEDRYTLGRQEDFRTGQVRPDTRQLPAYPVGWRERAPREVAVCTELHVDEQGRVYGTRPVHAETCNAAGTAWYADFRAAVEAATRQWLFEPSYRCTLPQGREPDGECREADQREAVPVARAFRFVFRRTPHGGVVSEGG